MTCIEQLKSIRASLSDTSRAAYELDKAIAALTAEQGQGGTTTHERPTRPAEEHTAPVDDANNWEE
ncbi:hypothetical protein JOF45_000397 [Nesterenkonia lacusekhoensis]|uniref:Uncharacterized protein n=1 Tax=Nesterenkonia lacusekhoensis TaxID=150832 RepID=A0ABS4T0K3_9MICC|nr:hypothetical protein [Nesterenkonia lacusekhoensis]